MNIYIGIIVGWLVGILIGLVIAWIVREVMFPCLRWLTAGLPDIVEDVLYWIIDSVRFKVIDIQVLSERLCYDRKQGLRSYRE